MRRQLLSFSAFWFAVLLSMQPATILRADDLAARVEALPTTGPAERWKKAVLRVAAERAGSCRETGAADEAAALSREIAAALPADAERMAAPNQAAKNLSTLFPVRVKTGNPYIAVMEQAARFVLAKPDKPWPKATPGRNLFHDDSTDEYDPRGTAARMDAYLWLFANPASPLHGDPEVLTRFLRRAHAYADTLDVERDIKAGVNVLDDFAIAPVSGALREFAALYPGLLLPGQKAQWDRAMRSAADRMMGKAQDFHGRYANIDLALSVELLNFGLHLRDDALLAKSHALLSAQRANIYPDGAVAYIGSQNETVNYHDTIALFLARYHEITGDPEPLEFLRKMEWYGPVSCGSLGEFWTAPSWKQRWNMPAARSAGGEFVVGSTGNPYARGMVAAPKFNDRQAAWNGWRDARAPVAWYRDDVRAKTLPDRYTVFDRNTVGPRAWYGPFNYAATLRPIPVDESGQATIMGAQVINPDGTMQAALMGVFPRVRVKPTANQPQSWAWLTSGLQGATTMGRGFSVVSGDYDLAVYGSSRKGVVAPWRGRQLWLGLPDRVVGLVEVMPGTGTATAYEVEGVVRMGFGGMAFHAPQTLAPEGADHFRYGDLAVRVLTHNFAAIDSETVTIYNPKAPVTDIVLHDPVSLADHATKPRTYPSGARYFYLVEVRPASAKTDARVRRIDDGGPGTLGLEVTLDGKRFTAWANTSGQEQRCAFPPAAIGDGRVSFYVSGSPGKPASAGPAPVIIPPHANAAAVTSADPADHLPAWRDYQEIVTYTVLQDR